MDEEYDELIKLIADSVAANFPCFDGGKGEGSSNPIEIALKDEPAQFALGVEVEQVVRHVLTLITANAKAAKAGEN